jgi:hypothetical protein
MVAKTPTTQPAPAGVTTRKQAAIATFQHVLTVVLEKDPTNDPTYFDWIAFNGIEKMGDLLTIEPDKMEITYYSHNGKMILPTLPMVGNVKILKAFHHFHCVKNNKKRMDSEDWMAVTPDEYDDFKVSAEYNSYQPMPPNPSKTFSTPYVVVKAIDYEAELNKTRPKPYVVVKAIDYVAAPQKTRPSNPVDKELSEELPDDEDEQVTDKVLDNDPELDDEDDDEEHNTDEALDEDIDDDDDCKRNEHANYTLSSPNDCVTIVCNTPITTTFLELTHVLDNKDLRYKKSVSLCPSLYPFIPKNLFELHLGSDGDVNEKDSLNCVLDDKIWPPLIHKTRGTVPTTVKPKRSPSGRKQKIPDFR